MDEQDLESLPVAQNRNPDDVEMTRYPKGTCAKGHKPIGKISMDNKWVCPECTRSIPNPNRPVNRIKPVGESAFKEIKKKGLDGKEYTEKVLKGREELQKEYKTDSEVKEIIRKTLPAVKEFSKAVEKDKFNNYPVEALDSITNFFDAAPSKTMADFKKVDKIRKAITKLRTQMKEYLGGK